MTSYSEKIYLFGGNSLGGRSTNTLFSYSLPNQTWEKVDYSGDPPYPIDSHCAVNN